MQTQALHHSGEIAGQGHGGSQVLIVQNMSEAHALASKVAEDEATVLLPLNGFELRSPHNDGKLQATRMMI